MPGQGWDPGAPALDVAGRGMMQQDGFGSLPGVTEVVKLVVKLCLVDANRRHHRSFYPTPQPPPRRGEGVGGWGRAGLDLIIRTRGVASKGSEVEEGASGGSRSAHLPGRAGR